MAYQPFPVQVKAHRALLLDGYKRALLYWGRRVGKTQWAIQQLMLSCILNQGQHHMVFKEYLQAETVAWNQYMHTIMPQMIAKTDKSTLTITFHYFGDKEKGIVFPVKMPDGTLIEIMQDHTLPASTIRLLGSDKAEQHRGGESNGMVFDEYQDQDPYNWDTVYFPFFATTNGWVAYMGTAKDIDWWVEMLDRAQLSEDWYYDKSLWSDNPKIDPGWVANSRKQAELEGKLGPWLQEMELIPFNQQGAVYMFNKEIHVIPTKEAPERLPKKATTYIALDFGFAEGHPMAACFIDIGPDDIWYQWDEIHGVGITMDELIADIRVKLGDKRLTAIVADSARPDLIDYLNSKGLSTIPSPKKQNSIVVGIQLLAQRLKPKLQIMGVPKPNYYITANCPKTIYDWTHYKYKELKMNRHPQEVPEKKFDDSLDAIRYLALFFKFGQQKDDKLMKSSVVKELNEFDML